MPIDTKTIERAKALLKIANDGLSTEQFTKAFKTLTAFVKKVKDNLEVRFIVLEEKIDNRLSRIKDGYTPVKGKDYFDGKDGERGSMGVQGATGEQGESIQGLNGADGSPDLPKAIRDKLEFLKEEEKLSIDAIQNLEKRLQDLEERPLGGKGGGGFSYAAFDQHIFDDQTFTGIQNGTNKVFTVIEVPNPLTSLKIYRGGARQRITEDYTVSGQTVTFIIAPVAGEILLYDLRS